MALYPNVRRDLIGVNPTTIYSYPTMRYLGARPQKGLSYFGNAVIEESSSVPEGSFGGASCLIAPIVSGGMASANGSSDITWSLSGDALNAGPVAGSASLSVSETGSLSLTSSMGGEATITVTGDSNVLSLTVGLDGAGSWTITGSSSILSMSVPVEGAGTVTVSGSANLKGLLSLEGESTPFAELSPQSLAESVWSYLSEGAFTTGDLLRLIAAVNCGKVSGGPTSPVFRDVNDTVNRVSGTADANGNRTSVTLNPD